MGDFMSSLMYWILSTLATITICIPPIYAVHTLLARPYYLRAICKLDTAGVVKRVEMNPSGVNGLPTFDTSVRFVGQDVLIKHVRAMYSIVAVVNVRYKPIDKCICYIAGYREYCIRL